MRKRSKSPKRDSSSASGAQRTKPKAEIDFNLIGRNSAGSPRQHGDSTPQSPAFADFSPPNTPFSSPLDSGFGHDRYVIFFYRPHFISAFLTGAVALFWVAFYNTSSDCITNAKRGVVGMCFAFLLYCSLPTPVPNAVFSRPHPMFWRIVTGASILYLLMLVFLLFQTVNDARILFTHMDPCRNGLATCGSAALIGADAGVAKGLPERSYAEECTVYTGGAGCKWWADRGKGEVACFRNVQDTIEDEFVLAHVLGWFAKALIVRHAGAAWINSIIFEFLEYTFQHWMPNFAECWWDHWILDVATANFLGIYLGHLFMRYFEVKTYNWMRISEIRSAAGKVSRAFLQFSPERWDSFHWHALESPRRLMAVLLLYSVILLADFNAFALKFILWVPPRNPLNVYRLVLLWMSGLMASREFYEYCTNRTVKRLGHHAWLVAMILIAEALVWLKFGLSEGQWSKPFPRTVVAGWALAGLAFAGWFGYHFHLVPARLRRAGPRPPSS